MIAFGSAAENVDLFCVWGACALGCLCPRRREKSRLLCIGCRSGRLGFFSAPSWIRREQALGNAFLKCMALVMGRVVFRAC